jgi:DNA-binding response OmpR family regulator
MKKNHSSKSQTATLAAPKPAKAAFRTDPKDTQVKTSEPNVCLLVMGRDTSFCEEAAFHLATIGLKVVPVTLTDDSLMETVRLHSPKCVLLDWDTLNESALKTCLFLRNYLLGRSTPIALVSREARSDSAIIKAFSAGVDDFIADATRPRLLSVRIKTLLHRRTPVAAAPTGSEQPHPWIDSQAV